MAKGDLYKTKEQLEYVLGNPQYSDIRVIKPTSIILSKFTKDPMFYTKARESEIISINARLLELLPEDQQDQGYDDDGNYYDAELFPVNPNHSILVHTTSIAGHNGERILIPGRRHVEIPAFGQWIWSETGQPNVLPSLKQRIIDTWDIGSERQNVVTYLKSQDIPDWTETGGYNLLSINLHLYVDVKKLLELRNIFYDPETLMSGPEEYKKTFMVFGGIPNQVVVKFTLEDIVNQLKI